MEIVIAEQGAYCFEPAFSPQEARGRASGHKAAAFGTISRLLSRPKDEAIAMEEQGLRYEPLWNAKAHLHFVYDRGEAYRVPIKTPHVTSVTIGPQDYAVDTSKGSAIELQVIEHCLRDERKELWLDAVTNQPIDAKPYLKAHVAAVVLDTFAPEGAEIVTPTVRASGVIRALLGDDFRPSDADTVHEESVEVECIDLYFRPMYAFKYTWAAKNKTAEVTIDAITAEIRSEPTKAGAALGKLLRPETLFDVGAETLNLVVPGGAIALRLAQAITDRRKA